MEEVAAPLAPDVPSESRGTVEHERAAKRVGVLHSVLHRAASEPLSRALDAASLASVRNVPGPLYELRLLGDPMLHEPCDVEVTEANLEEAKLVQDALKQIMVAHRGLGLSANQIGSRLALFVANVRASPRVAEVRTFLNPRVEGVQGALTRCFQEGCLSIPDFRTQTWRYPSITLSWGIGDARSQETFGMGTRNYAAQIVQHELDHIAGRLLTDGLPRQQRRAAERAVEKWRASQHG